MDSNPSVLYPVLYEKYNDTLSIKDLANYLGVSYNTACKLLRERSILGRRVGREWRIPRHHRQKSRVHSRAEGLIINYIIVVQGTPVGAVIMCKTFYRSYKINTAF